MALRWTASLFVVFLDACQTPPAADDHAGEATRVGTAPEGQTTPRLVGPCSAPEPVVHVDEDAGMVIVPAGPFWYGCNPRIDDMCQPNEFIPSGCMTIDAFEIDQKEITWGEYSKFNPNLPDGGWSCGPGVTNGCGDAELPDARWIAARRGLRDLRRSRVPDGKHS